MIPACLLYVSTNLQRINLMKPSPCIPSSLPSKLQIKYTDFLSTPNPFLWVFNLRPFSFDEDEKKNKKTVILYYLHKLQK